MEARRIDATGRIARRNLAGGDIGCCINRKLERDRQLCEIDSIAFSDDVIPCRLSHCLAWDVLLTALAESARQLSRINTKTGRQKPPIGPYIGYHRHLAAIYFFENNDWASVRALELIYNCSHLEVRLDVLPNAQKFVRIVGFHHVQKAAQALPVEIVHPTHLLTLKRPMG